MKSEMEEGDGIEWEVLKLRVGKVINMKVIGNGMNRGGGVVRGNFDVVSVAWRKGVLGDGYEMEGGGVEGG